MNLHSQTTIKTIETPDQTEFEIETEDGWLKLLGLAAIIGVLIAAGLLTSKYWLVLFGIAMVVMLAVSMLDNPRNRTFLFVNGDEIRAKSGAEIFTTFVELRAREIKSLSYLPGSDETPCGLYAYCGWNQRCLVSGLNKEDTESILFAIRKKYPFLEQGDGSAGTLLYRDGSGITRLGIDSAGSSATPSVTANR